MASNKCLSIGLVGLFIALAVEPALAEGGRWWEPGLITFKKAKATVDRTVEVAQSEMKRRHEQGMEYALENEKFQSLLNSYITDSMFNSTLYASDPAAVTQAAAKMTKTAIRELKRIDDVAVNGITREAVHKAVEDALGAFVKANCVCAVALPPTKVATAFVTAYWYGFRQ